MPIATLDGVSFEITDEQVLLEIPPIVVTENHVRRKRDALIAATDTWGLADYPATAAQTAYRQALRDITDQSGFPTNITWPTKPE